MFHSVGRLTNTDARILRRVVSTIVARFPAALVNGVPLEDWIKWETGMTAQQYSWHIGSLGTWGGAIDLMLLARCFRRSILVWERTPKGYKQLAEVVAERAEGPPMNLLYMGRSHYSALRPT